MFGSRASIHPLVWWWLFGRHESRKHVKHTPKTADLKRSPGSPWQLLVPHQQPTERMKFSGCFLAVGWDGWIELLGLSRFFNHMLWSSWVKTFGSGFAIGHARKKHLISTNLHVPEVTSCIHVLKHLSEFPQSQSGWKETEKKDARIAMGAFKQSRWV